jgi:hypothetical protein
VTLKIDLDGRADHWIVIDDENAYHVSPPEADIYFQSNQSSVTIVAELSDFFGFDGGSR